MKEKLVMLLLSVSICLLGVMFFERAEQQTVDTMGRSTERPVVVIDAGHGGTWYRPKKFDS